MDSQPDLVVEDLLAAPGTRVTGLVDVDLGTARVSIPLVLINGASPGPRIGVTAGIHGAEYVSIAALRRVTQELDPGRVTGSLVASLVSNPAAFAVRSIYVDPLDGKNLNRVFPGDPSGSPSERLAAWLFRNVIRPSDRFVDMHCGDMNEALASFAGVEDTGDAEVDTLARTMADAYGLDFVVFGPTAGSTTTAAAAAGIPAVLGEVGGQGLWPEEDVALHAAGFLPEPGHGPRRAAEKLARDVWLRSTESGCFHPAVSVGERVTQGQFLGEVQDFFGRRLVAVEAPIGGVVLFLVTSLAMNAGDPLLAMGTTEA